MLPVMSINEAYDEMFPLIPNTLRKLNPGFTPSFSGAMSCCLR